MSASPAVARFPGVGGWAEACRYTEEMLEITAGRPPHLWLPTLDDLGMPCGIDVRKVSKPKRPSCPGNTGIAHHLAGVGQVGAGVVQAPLVCFV